MSQLDDLKKNKDIVRFMTKYRYLYGKDMKSDLVNLIAAKVLEGRLDELDKANTAFVDLDETGVNMYFYSRNRELTTPMNND